MERTYDGKHSQITLKSEIKDFTKLDNAFFEAMLMLFDILFDNTNSAERNKAIGIILSGASKAITDEFFKLGEE